MEDHVDGLIKRALAGNPEALTAVFDHPEYGGRLRASVAEWERCDTLRTPDAVEGAKKLAAKRIQRALREGRKKPKGLGKDGFYSWMEDCYFDSRLHSLSTDIRADKRTLKRVFDASINMRGDLIRGKAAKVLDRRTDDPDTDDVFQMTCKTAYTKLESAEDDVGHYDPDRSTFAEWTKGICANKARKYLEKRRRDLGVPIQLAAGDDAGDWPGFRNKPDPDTPTWQKLVKFEAYLLALRIVCRFVAHPHKTFAFLLSQVILGNSGSGSAKSTAQKYGDVPFDGPSGAVEDSLYQTYKREFAKQSGITEADGLFQHVLCLESLRDKLYASSSESLATPIALTSFRSYCTRDLALTIAEWCRQVKRQVEAEVRPNPTLIAHSPTPANCSKCVDPNVVLSWSPGAGGSWHEVYFGKDEMDVTGGDESAFRGGQAATTFQPGPLELDTTYYWRVDEILAYGGKRSGPIWQFTTIGPSAKPKG